MVDSIVFWRMLIFLPLLFLSLLIVLLIGAAMEKEAF